MNITVYTSPNCQQCTATKRWLDKRGINYKTIDVTENPNDLAAIKELGYKAAPVTIVSTGDPEMELHWYGFDVNNLRKYATREMSN
jgi:glutaredoxin-like protein NrdH